MTEPFRFPQVQSETSAQDFQRKAEILAEIAESRSAGGFVKRIVGEIRTFESFLDPAHEVGVRLVSFGQAMTFHVTHIGFIEPSLITFHGVTDAKEPVKLVQHVTQISFLLIKVKRLEPEKPKKPIGFSEGGREE